MYIRYAAMKMDWLCSSIGAFDQMLAFFMTSCLNHSPSLATLTRCWALILGVQSPHGEDRTAHTHSRPYARTIETLESGFVIQLGHTIISSLQKASSAQNCNAAFPKAPSCSSRSPRLLVKMSPCRIHWQVLYAQGLAITNKHIWIKTEDIPIRCYTSTFAHTNHTASLSRMEQGSRPFPPRDL